MTSHHRTAPTKLSIAIHGFIALAVAMGVGRFAFTPQLPVMQADLGLSLAAGGWLAGANYLGYLVGAILAGKGGASAAVLMRIGLLLVVASTAAMAIPAPLAWWLVMRFMAGVASAWVLIGTASLVLSRLSVYEGSKYDGLVFAGVGGGIALAGLICHIGFLLGMGAAALWLVLAGFALAGILIVIAGDKTNIKTKVSVPPQIQLNNNIGGVHRLVLCYGLFGLGYILPATYLPSQARLLLQDPALFGWVWPIFGFAAALSTLSMVMLSHWSRRHMWAIAQLVMVAGVLLPTVMPGLAGLTLSALCVGGTFMMISLLGLQEVRNQVGANAQKWLAIATAAFAIGQLCGPLIANIIMLMGLKFEAALWVGAAALIISSFLLLTYRQGVH